MNMGCWPQPGIKLPNHLVILVRYLGLLSACWLRSSKSPITPGTLSRSSFDYQLRAATTRIKKYKERGNRVKFRTFDLPDLLLLRFNTY